MPYFLIVIIDGHTHIGDFRAPPSLEGEPVTLEGLIARLDDEGIAKAVLLPAAEAPEGVTFPELFSPPIDIVGQIRAAAEHPDRIFLFGNADPRWAYDTPKTDFSWLLERFRSMGCLGIGEVTAHVPIDDPRVVNLFNQCGRWKLPVLYHGTGKREGAYGLIDEPGSPRLEKLLREVSDTIVIGHGQGFWSEIGPVRTAEEKSGYPEGPILEEGSLWRLMREHHNLYADISAGSGHNALKRDEKVGIRFLNEFTNRVIFGTDVCQGNLKGRMPHLAFLRRLESEGKISTDTFKKITSVNICGVLGVHP